jgi:hypothetical protein
LPFDSHAENVCSTLKESDVVLTELSLAATIDLQHTIRRAITQSDVNGTKRTSGRRLTAKVRFGSEADMHTVHFAAIFDLQFLIELIEQSRVHWESPAV